MHDQPLSDIDMRAEGRQSADYVLRTAQQNLLQLSAMADQKASVVLGSAFVMATIVFGDVAGNGLDPVRVAILVTAIGSGLFAAIALAPRMVGAPAHDQPLFFGSIATMERDEYRHLMREMLDDDRRIHDAIVCDLHSASRVLLHSKFRPLQVSYLVLVVGMTSTLIVALTT